MTEDTSSNEFKQRAVGGCSWGAPHWRTKVGWSAPCAKYLEWTLARAEFRTDQRPPRRAEEGNWLSKGFERGTQDS